MRSLLIGLLVLMTGAVSAPLASAQDKDKGKTLDIYVIDTEGGKATLFVSPSGESLLMDTGNPGGRDVDRIMGVVKEAGLTQLDYVLLTHYHVDHVGGLQDLATRIPITHYVDHGPTVEPREQVQGFQQAYAELYKKADHIVVKPGDTLPIKGIDWRIVSSAGNVLKTPLPGGGQPNPFCADFTPRENLRDPENGQSVGSVISYGKFRTIDLGDLLWNNEGDLMCPNNPIGQVDVYLVSHHGTDPSGSPALVHGLAPRVAVMQNGTRKGGTLQTYQTLRSASRLQDIWQLHWSYNGLLEQNPPGLFIANIDDPQVIANVLTSPPASFGRGGGGAAPQGNGARGGEPGAAPAGTPAAGAQPADAPAPGAAPAGAPPAGGPPAGGPPAGGRPAAHTGPAFLIKIAANADGTFTVTNTRNGFSKTYK